MKRNHLIALAILLTASSSQAANTPQKAFEAQTMDRSLLLPTDEPFVRYIWIPPWRDEKTDKPLADAAVNLAAGHSATMHQLQRVSAGIYRIDLRLIKADPRTWDKMARRDQYFYVQNYAESTTGDGAPSPAVQSSPVPSTAAAGTGSGPVIGTSCPHCGADVVVPPGPADGFVRCRGCALPFKRKTARTIYHQPARAKVQPVKQAGGQVVKFELAAYLGLDTIATYAGLSKVKTPILSVDTLIYYGLASIDFGVYYDLRKTPDTLDGLFKLNGVDPRSQAVKATLEGALIMVSGVTAKARVILRYVGIYGPVYVTWDATDDQLLDPNRNPVYNLTDFDKGTAALEVIYPLPNGLQGFALYDGDGKRVDSAPDFVVCDHTAPGPKSLPRGGGYGTARLHAFSCFSCHGPSGGLIAADNVLPNLIQGRADLFSQRKDQFGDLDQLESIYGGDLNQRMKLDVAQLDGLMTRLTGQDTRAVYAGLTRIRNDVIDNVDPQRAIQELAVAGPPLDVFRNMAPRSFEAFVVREDPMVLALRNGIAIGRLDWARIYSDVQARIHHIPFVPEELSK